MKEKVLLKDEGTPMGSSQKTWSQDYTCENCSYLMTISFDGKKLRVKGKGPQEQKPNMRWNSPMRSNTTGLQCPQCGHPVPAER